MTGVNMCRVARLLAGLFFLALLGGCATPQMASLLRTPPADLPQRTELTAVPFNPQEAYYCGPASLATVLQAANIGVTPDELAPKVYLPERQGTLQVELNAAARRYGMIPYELDPSLPALLREVANGNPAIVLQNLSFPIAPVWHYAVVVGYDLPKKEVVLRSGPDPRQVLPMDTFERTWSRGGHWAIVVLPPGKIPQTAHPDKYVSAVAALERTGKVTEAQVSYQAALSRWPDHLGAQMGLGNTLYAQGKLAEAEQIFKTVTRSHPEAAPAFNNLAHILAERGQLRDAQVAAQRAVALGGSHQPMYRETLREIEKKMAGVKVQ